MEFLILAVLLGLIPGFIAASKGHNFLLWWAFGALLLIVALPVSFFLTPTGKKRKCPFCTEMINTDANVCPHCQREIAIPVAQRSVISSDQQISTSPPKQPNTRPFKIAMGVLFVLVVGYIALAIHLHRNDPLAKSSNCADEDYRLAATAEFRGIKLSCEEAHKIRSEMDGQ